MKFKTNAKCAGCKTTILNHLQSKFPNENWSLDLENTDKVLEMHGVPDDEARAREVENAVAETGFKGTWMPQTGY
ncbi:MAG: heavy metal transport/detoxification protein [Muribaculaceae bacterium]|nr:heavy metal transport/detoxification protein [Muribaculaceae bacterium]